METLLPLHDNVVVIVIVVTPIIVCPRPRVPNNMSSSSSPSSTHAPTRAIGQAMAQANLGCQQGLGLQVMIQLGLGPCKPDPGPAHH